MAVVELEPVDAAELRDGLNEYHETQRFSGCDTMGDLVRTNIEVVISKTK